MSSAPLHPAARPPASCTVSGSCRTRRSHQRPVPQQPQGRLQGSAGLPACGDAGDKWLGSSHMGWTAQVQGPADAEAPGRSPGGLGEGLARILPTPDGCKPAAHLSHRLTPASTPVICTYSHLSSPVTPCSHPYSHLSYTRTPADTPITPSFTLSHPTLTSIATSITSALTHLSHPRSPVIRSRLHPHSPNTHTRHTHTHSHLPPLPAALPERPWRWCPLPLLHGTLGVPERQGLHPCSVGRGHRACSKAGQCSHGVAEGRGRCLAGPDPGMWTDSEPRTPAGFGVSGGTWGPSSDRLGRRQAGAREESPAFPWASGRSCCTSRVTSAPSLGRGG